MNATQIIGSAPPTDYAQERAIYDLFDWSKERALEKILSLNRVMQTVTTSKQAREVLDIGLVPLSNFLNSGNHASAHPEALKSLGSQWLSKLETVSDEPTRATDAIERWKYLKNCFAKLKIVGISDPQKVIASRMENAIVASGQFDKYAIPQLCDNGRNPEFTEMSFRICRRLVTDTELTPKTYQLFCDMYESLKKLYSIATDRITVRDILAKDIEAKMADYANTCLSQEFADPMALKNIGTTLSSAPDGLFSKEAKVALAQKSREFLDAAVEKKISWEDLAKTQKILGVATESFYLEFIKNSGPKELVTQKFEGIRDPESIAKLKILKMLRQEELLLSLTEEASTCNDLIGAKEQIPAELPHLHEIILNKAKELLK